MLFITVYFEKRVSTHFEAQITVQIRITTEIV